MDKIEILTEGENRWDKTKLLMEEKEQKRKTK